MTRRNVPWNEVLYREFSRLGMLTEFQREVLRTRIMGYSITQQAMSLNVSESTINRTIRELKTRYDEVQPYSDLLPPRRTSEEEKWMDEN